MDYNGIAILIGASAGFIVAVGRIVLKVAAIFMDAETPAA